MRHELAEYSRKGLRWEVAEGKVAGRDYRNMASLLGVVVGKEVVFKWW